MSRIEIALISGFSLIAIILASVFLPTFFIIALAVSLIWFFVARGNGYRILSYAALLLGVAGLLLVYPYNQTESDQEAQVKELASKTGAVSEKNLSIKRIEGSGGDAIFLAYNKDPKEVVLARTSTENTKVYSIEQINKETGQKDYDPSIGKQNDYMAADFEESYPLKYGLSFMLLLLPLFFISALPSRRREGEKMVFDSRDGSFVAWLSPAGPGEDVKGVTGSAGVQLMLLLGFVMTLAFVLNMPSISYISSIF